VVFKIGIEDLFYGPVFMETSNLLGLSANSSIALGEYLDLEAGWKLVAENAQNIENYFQK